MPELPEVETIRRQMENNLVGRKITDVIVRFGKRLEPAQKKFIEAVRGEKFVGFSRRAKLLMLHLSNKLTIAAHLKMTGKFVLKPHGTEPEKHVHVIFVLDNGQDLWFHDVRKFGYLKIISLEKVEELFKGDEFGPEPLDKKFSLDIFESCIKSRKNKKIKPLLMEPKCIAGIGNIYADEALWHALVRPTRRAGSLKKPELAKLYDGIIVSLTESLKHRGASSENYRDLFDTEGESTNFLHAYNQEKCARCKGAIKRIVIGTRSAHYCPKCQK
ncbi:MAG: bifunctional DNA-formamidopyrimidine glycosylase/DNA-(apurinic or apyrimidinic site) lyase [bacterium]